jgi:hypothetical protein
MKFLFAMLVLFSALVLCTLAAEPKAAAAYGFPLLLLSHITVFFALHPYCCAAAVA